METIFALSSAPGKAGVSVIRVSGPKAFDLCRMFCGDIPPPRVASVRLLRDASGAPIDQALVLTFLAGSSFTGEDSVELQTHGSIAVVSALLAEMGRVDGCRIADAGEFTRRALENGTLDAAQVEGLADLIEAETEAQRQQALRVLSGDLGRRAEGWRRDLIRASALIEATIDFADEEVPEDVRPEVEALVETVRGDLRREIDGVDVAERIRNGFEVAIVGAPNVGKSTLLNRLAGRDAALTSEIAGTTRDVIEVRMDLGGLPVTFLDTAGIRESDDHVETLGVARALERAKQSDIRVFLVMQGEQPPFPPVADDVFAVAKADTVTVDALAISGLTGEGVDDLIARLKSVLQKRSMNAGLAIRQRHKDAMVRGDVALAEALALLAVPNRDDDVVAEELRSAVRALDSIVGRVDMEMILDEIFASFCLGK